MAENPEPSRYLDLATDIVSAFVSNNAIPMGEVPALISSVHSALLRLTEQPIHQIPEKPTPAVPIKKSVTNDYIVSLFDGRKFKSLKRHLRTHHHMSPDDYRRYWGLPPDYPMVAPNYAKARSELARSMGLGQKRRSSKASRARAAKRAG